MSKKTKRVVNHNETKISNVQFLNGNTINVTVDIPASVKYMFVAIVSFIVGFCASDDKMVEAIPNEIGICITRPKDEK